MQTRFASEIARTGLVAIAFVMTFLFTPVVGNQNQPGYGADQMSSNPTYSNSRQCRWCRSKASTPDDCESPDDRLGQSDRPPESTCDSGEDKQRPSI